jgi:RNA polymerase sigma-70 factor (ECF subfamily)
VDKLTDRELVLQLQGGSLEALGALYDRHSRLVYRTALVIAGDPEAASDLLQDVFLRLHRFADRVDPGRPLEPWLYRMTVNQSHDWVKRMNRWSQPLEDFVEWLASAGKNPPYEAVERKDEWQQIQQIISSLPLNQRIVVVLYYLNDQSMKEISDILDIPVGTVKSRLHYGRLTLKKKLELHKNILPDFNYESP